MNDLFEDRYQNFGPFPTFFPRNEKIQNEPGASQSRVYRASLWTSSLVFIVHSGQCDQIFNSKVAKFSTKLPKSSYNSESAFLKVMFFKLAKKSPSK